MDPRPNVGLVLGAGGFRGLAHAGVLHALRAASIEVRFMIGVSIGGLITAFHAGLGLSPEAIAAKLQALSTPGLFSLGVALRPGWPVPRSLRDRARPLLRELERLREADWNRLHHGVEKIGLLALDLRSGREVFVTSGERPRLSLIDMALGGASIPGLFPIRVARVGDRTHWLVDGGLSRTVPAERALAVAGPDCRILAVDLQVIRGLRDRSRRRWNRLEARFSHRFRRVCPRVEMTGALFFRPEEADALFRAGGAAITPDVLAWLRGRDI